MTREEFIAFTHREPVVSHHYIIACNRCGQREQGAVEGTLHCNGYKNTTAIPCFGTFVARKTGTGRGRRVRKASCLSCTWISDPFYGRSGRVDVDGFARKHEELCAGHRTHIVSFWELTEQKP